MHIGHKNTIKHKSRGPLEFLTTPSYSFKKDVKQLTEQENEIKVT
jgi:hypothetical protein